MIVMKFDTLTYSKELIQAGETKEIAEVHAHTIRNMIDNELVTKDYLDMRLKELGSDLVIKLGGLIVSGIAVLAVLMKVL